MNNVLHQQRIKCVYHMLLELANGNLAYRLAPSGEDEAFDELVRLLNQVAEKIQQADYINPYAIPIDSDSDTDAVMALVQKVQAYILNHLEERLPTAEVLSKMFSSNAFALKEGFRTVLHTSIYQYYNDERLKKAHLLIEQTAVPLKEIAFICGFNAYTNFYKAFKKKYNYTPIDVTRIGN